MRKILLVLTLIVQSLAFGQIEEVRRITKTLCSPEFHGRGYVNSGDSIAAEFIAAEFKKLGLKPVKGSYFQAFTFPVNTFPGSMSVRQGQKRLEPGVHYLVDAGSAGTNVQLKPKFVPLEILLNSNELALEIKRIEKSDDFNSIALDMSMATGDTLKKLAGLTQQLAQIMPVIEITNKKFTWSVSQERFNYPLIQVQDSVYQPNVPLRVDIQTNLYEAYESRNVMAYLPAKKKTKKTIVFTAHYDHLGRMGSLTYFPGANDNASGTAMLISMAKYFTENPADCNILFIAFAGEEAGLVGSKYFVEHPKVPLKSISFVINLDIMGSGEEGITVVNATLYEQQFKALQAINEEKQLLAQVKSRGPAANSDHYWFTEKGVPAFFIYTMGTNKNYHDVFDTYENLTFVEYQDITTLLVEFVKRAEF